MCVFLYVFHAVRRGNGVSAGSPTSSRRVAHVKVNNQMLCGVINANGAMMNRFNDMSVVWLKFRSCCLQSHTVECADCDLSAVVQM